MILNAISKMILEYREFDKLGKIEKGLADKTVRKMLMKIIKSRVLVFERRHERTRVRYHRKLDIK